MCAENLKEMLGRLLLKDVQQLKMVDFSSFVRKCVKRVECHEEIFILFHGINKFLITKLQAKSCALKMAKFQCFSFSAAKIIKWLSIYNFSRLIEKNP